MLLYHCDTIHNNKNGYLPASLHHQIVLLKTYIDICIYEHRSFIQCCFILILPKGSTNKNLIFWSESEEIQVEE